MLVLCIQAVRRECEQYGGVIDSLSDSSLRLTPVRRYYTVRLPADLRCACDYKDQEVFLLPLSGTSP